MAMDRRLFISGMALSAYHALAQSSALQWRAGTDYVTLPSAQPIQARAGRVEVVQAFSYTCGHCYRFEPHLQSWLKAKPPYVDFLRLPSLWDDRHRAHAKLYYTLLLIGRNDLDQAAFDAIHFDEIHDDAQGNGNPLFAQDPQETLGLQSKFAAAHGINGKTFKEAYDSTTVAYTLEQDAVFLRRFQVAETPAIVIDGKYMTDASHMRSAGAPSEPEAFNDLIEITDYLISLEKRTAG